MEVLGWIVAGVLAVTIAGCSSIKCGLLGSDSLYEACRDNEIIVPIYTVPTWIPGQSLSELWMDDAAAQARDE